MKPSLTTCLLWPPMHLNSYSTYSLNLHVAFRQELPLTCPVLLLNIFSLGKKIQHRVGLLASILWEVESGGDLWSAVSRSELNEVPGNEPTPESPQKFPVNTPALCLPSPLPQASSLNHEFPCSLFHSFFPLRSASITGLQIQTSYEMSSTAPKVSPGDFILLLYVYVV